MGAQNGAAKVGKEVTFGYEVLRAEMRQHSGSTGSSLA